MLPDIIKKGAPWVKKVTAVDTVCNAKNINNIFKEMLLTTHQLLHLYRTTAITSATSEHSLSAVR